ncbi:hypothetical protein FACS189485_07300 [Spirochaetia bacterium]|nr:hypothetical protein FACS189485_07300 [Spirochaetia bacterium]
MPRAHTQTDDKKEDAEQHDNAEDDDELRGKGFRDRIYQNIISLQSMPSERSLVKYEVNIRPSAATILL